MRQAIVDLETGRFVDPVTGSFVDYGYGILLFR